MTLPPTFHGFADQSPIEHLLTTVGGVLVCAGVYFVSLDLLMGGIEVAISEAHEATALRRRSAAIAGVASFAYFSIAFIFARGGPLLSFFSYPSVSIIYGIPFATWVVFGKIQKIYTPMDLFYSLRYLLGMESGWPPLASSLPF